MNLIQVGDHDPEPNLSDPIEGIPYRMDCALREMDDFMVMARETPTADIVASNWRTIDQIKTRAELILSFIDARKPPPLKVVGRAS